MLVSRLAVAKPFHKILPFYINGTNTIDDDVYMCFMHLNMVKMVICSS